MTKELILYKESEETKVKLSRVQKVYTTDYIIEFISNKSHESFTIYNSEMDTSFNLYNSLAKLVVIQDFISDISK